jgi:hypothetical protein
LCHRKLEFFKEDFEKMNGKLKGGFKINRLILKHRSLRKKLVICFQKWGRMYIGRFLNDIQGKVNDTMQSNFIMRLRLLNIINIKRISYYFYKWNTNSVLKIISPTIQSASQTVLNFNKDREQDNVRKISSSSNIGIWDSSSKKTLVQKIALFQTLNSITSPQKGIKFSHQRIISIPIKKSNKENTILKRIRSFEVKEDQAALRRFLKKWKYFAIGASSDFKNQDSALSNMVEIISSRIKLTKKRVFHSIFDLSLRSYIKYQSEILKASRQVSRSKKIKNPQQHQIQGLVILESNKFFSEFCEL